MAAITLNSNQQAVAAEIVTYGVSNGYSQADIANAVKTAFIESGLGENTVPAPDSPCQSCTGLYQYNDATWAYGKHSGDRTVNQYAIPAYYKDTDR